MSITSPYEASIRVKAAILNNSKHGEHSSITVFRVNQSNMVESVFTDIVYTQERIASGDKDLVGIFSQGSHPLGAAEKMISEAALNG